MKLISYLIILLSFTIQSCGQNNNSKETITTKTAANEEQAIEMLHEFYTLYITECCKMPENKETINLLKTKYLTKKLLVKLETEDWDYDPIINAQDCDKSWIKTLEIKPQVNRTNGYNVYYSYNDANKTCIQLSIIYSNGKYLIDDILENTKH